VTDKILIVDDDPHILEGMRAVLINSFQVRTAHGPEQGLQVLRSSGPYAVVVSDLKMPGMSGIDFLARVREVSHQTVRVMLTGYADVETAVAAVNRGEVFRFHTKPCPTDVLRQTLSDALSKFRTESLMHQDSLQGAAEARRALSDDDAMPGVSVPVPGIPLMVLLTGKELRVADLIRMDASSKEIAKVMNISPRTVEAHRENIRKKLGLANVKINLQSYLKSIM